LHLSPSDASYFHAERYRADLDFVSNPIENLKGKVAYDYPDIQIAVVVLITSRDAPGHHDRAEIVPE